jgi:hypothetical protein
MAPAQEARIYSHVVGAGPAVAGRRQVAERVLPGLERRLKAEVPGGTSFDRFTRGRYATDASHYQIMPLGVVTPRTIEEAERAIAVCRAEGVPVTARGGGSSQAGQDGQPLRHRRLLEASHPHP